MNVYIYVWAVATASISNPMYVQILKLAVDVFNSGGDEKLAMPGLYPDLPRWSSSSSYATDIEISASEYN